MDGGEEYCQFFYGEDMVEEVLGLHDVHDACSGDSGKLEPVPPLSDFKRLRKFQFWYTSHCILLSWRILPIHFSPNCNGLFGLNNDRRCCKQCCCGYQNRHNFMSFTYHSTTVNSKMRAPRGSIIVHKVHCSLRCTNNTSTTSGLLWLYLYSRELLLYVLQLQMVSFCSQAPSAECHFSARTYC